MQTQKDKIAVDISQIPQEILKIYDRWRFFKYLFAGIFMSFIVFLLSLWNVDRTHPFSFIALECRPHASVFAFCIRDGAFCIGFDLTCLLECA